MKRKTFIKKLMGAGLPRNTAASIAEWVQGSTYGYKEQLPAYLRHHRRPFLAQLTTEERGTYDALTMGGWKA